MNQLFHKVCDDVIDDHTAHSTIPCKNSIHVMCILLLQVMYIFGV